MQLQTIGFPRSDGPLVTVLLPTRGRPDWLAKSVDSLYSLAVNKDKIEFLFRVDTDDLPTIQACCQIVDMLPNATLNIGKRGNGFRSMHHWINAMCVQARGDWLLIWNDDCQMKSSGWDHVLLHTGARSWHNVPDIFMLTIPSVGRPACNEFMFLRRKVTQVLGHWALSPHNDNWIHRVMTGINSVATIAQVEVEHFSDRIGDQTRAESEAAYQDTDETLNSGPALRAIQQDVSTLLDYINAHNPG